MLIAVGYRPVRMRALLVLVTIGSLAAGCSFSESSGDLTLEEVRELPGPAPYYVGGEFEGLPLTAISGTSPRLTFVYGDCEPSGDDGGCAPPLEVQVWPIDRRAPGVISDMLECQKVTVRGAQGAFYGGPDLDLYVGDHTVVIFAESREMALRAAEVLRTVDADSVTTGELPEPALDPEAALERCSDA